MDPLNVNQGTTAQTETEAIVEPKAARLNGSWRNVSLSETEKVHIWQQRFFEAQASFEEYLMEHGGMPAIYDWIEANSSITSKRFSLLVPASEDRAAYAVTRFVNQLRCYDSDIICRYDEATNSYEVTNRDCGILHYRREAALARVRLTFESPCEYCTKLNSKIMQKYVENTSVEVDYKVGGCQWRVVVQSESIDETVTPNSG